MDKAGADQRFGELHGDADAVDDGHAELARKLAAQVGHAGASENDRLRVVLGERARTHLVAIRLRTASLVASSS